MILIISVVLGLMFIFAFLAALGRRGQSTKSMLHNITISMLQLFIVVGLIGGGIYYFTR